MPQNDSSRLMPALVLGAVIFVVAFAVLFSLGDYRFIAAAFLALLLAILSTIVLYLGFGMSEASGPGHTAGASSAQNRTAAKATSGTASAAAAGTAAAATGASASSAEDDAAAKVKAEEEARLKAEAETKAAEEARLAAEAEAKAKAAEAEAARQAEAEAARKAQADAEAEAARKAEADAEATRQAEAEAARQAAEAEAQAAREAEEARAAAERQAEESAAAVPVGAMSASSSDDSGKDYDGDGVLEGTNEGTRPAGLDAPRGGVADDLKRIKGVGPKLEKLCNSLGFWHFDQVAAWTSDEVAWVDANLMGFKGRVSRDEWVAQAKLLASGGETEFSKRVDDGDVY